MIPNYELYEEFNHEPYFPQELNVFNPEPDNLYINDNNFNNKSKFMDFEGPTNANTNEDKIFNINILNKEIPKEDINIANEEKKDKKKKCGRKREREDKDNVTEHNKYSDDNIRRKCKHLVLRSTIDLLNDKIGFIYNYNIGNGIFKKELQTINQSQKSNATIEFNKEFLNKTLEEIFSDKISGRYTNYPPDHNKKLIQSLLNETDENKKIYFQKIFGLTFIDCLKHFREEIHINELEGLKCFNDIKEEFLQKYKDGENYIEQLKYYINNYEEIINKKRPRKPRNKKQEKEEN